MTRPPEEVIRRYLDEHGDLDAVAIEHLLVSWRIEELTPQARVTIGEALAAVGVRVEPPLEFARKHGTVALSVVREERAAPPAAEPSPAPARPRRPTLRRPRLPRPRPPSRTLRQPPAPEPPPPEPPAPEPPAPEPPPEPAPTAAGPAREPGKLLAALDRPRALILGGGLAALIALWVPWVEWSSPSVVNFPFERSADAWDALGVEPLAIVLALLFGAATLVKPEAVPDRLRAYYPGVISTLALAFGALAVIVSLVNALAPPDSSAYRDADVRGGPFLALAGSLALTAGVWRARPDAERDPAPGLTPQSPGTGNP